MKKERFAAILLIAVLLFATSVSAFAGYDVNEYEDDIYYANIVARITLKSMGKSEEISSPIVLENLRGNAEAVLFDIVSGGYIIVNINDLSVPEISFEGENPYIGYENPVYNGPLSYYWRDENNVYYSVRNCDIIDIVNIEVYEKQPLEDKEEYVAKLQKENKKRSKSGVVTKYLSSMPQNWSYNTTGFCGALASAICMRYYYDNVSTRYVDVLLLGEVDLTELMRGYVGRGGTTKRELARGLNDYFNFMGVDNVANYNGNTFSFNTVVNSINRDRPAIVGIHRDPYGDHWIVAWGYYYKTNNTNSQYVIVIDGWGNDQVFISVSENCLREVVYFSK